MMFVTISLMCFAPKNSYRELNLYYGYKNYVQKETHEDRLLLILKTIRIIESREQYNIKGASGEYGAYQFMSRTWRCWSNKYFGKLLAITNPINQDKVANASINELVKKGYSNAEIASVWNCGSKYYKNKKGWNSKGIYYDVPRYVNRFITVLNSLKKCKPNKVYISNFLQLSNMRNRKVLLKNYYNSLKKQCPMNELKIQYKIDTGLSADAFNNDELDVLTPGEKKPNYAEGEEILSKAKNIIYNLPSLPYIKWLEEKVLELKKA